MPPEADDPMAGFLGGLIWKTLVLGFLAAAGVGLWIDPALGRAVFVGAGLAAANAAALAWIGRKILRPDDEDDAPKAERGTAFWAVLLGLKLVALLALAFAVVVLFGVHPLGLAIGYTMFLAATIWQTVTSFAGVGPADRRSDPESNDNSEQRQ